MWRALFSFHALAHTDFSPDPCHPTPCFRVKFRQALLICCVTGVAVLYSSIGLAAQKVVLRYGVLQESVSVEELTTFAETGKASPALQSHLNKAKANPEDVKRVLTQEITIDPVLLDRGLNSPIGNILLDQIGNAIHTPENVANRQAIRATLILSASGDKKISLLEVIQKYPTPELYLEGDRLLNAYNQLSAFEQQLRKVFGVLNILQK